MNYFYFSLFYIFIIDDKKGNGLKQLSTDGLDGYIYNLYSSENAIVYQNGM